MPFTTRQPAWRVLLGEQQRTLVAGERLTGESSVLTFAATTITTTIEEQASPVRRPTAPLSNSISMRPPTSEPLNYRVDHRTGKNVGVVACQAGAATESAAAVSVAIRRR